MYGYLEAAWNSLKDVPNIVAILATAVTALAASAVALIAAIIAAFVSLHNSRKALKQADEALSVQRASSARTAASFIADKRQDWIDSLRSDIATHLAESLEIAWKWDAIRARIADVLTDQTLMPGERKKQANELTAEFSDANGARDRSHQERHHRLRFRLNPKEPNHQILLDHLIEIRKTLENDIPNASDPKTAGAQLRHLKTLVERSDAQTTAILKIEWERVKQEVAYPEDVIHKIPPP